jgi:hypothetical protein
MKVIRLSCTVVWNGDRDVTMILLHSFGVVFLARYSSTADPVMPFPPVMRATLAIPTKAGWEVLENKFEEKCGKIEKIDELERTAYRNGDAAFQSATFVDVSASYRLCELITTHPFYGRLR